MPASLAVLTAPQKAVLVSSVVFSVQPAWYDLPAWLSNLSRDQLSSWKFTFESEHLLE